MKKKYNILYTSNSGQLIGGGQKSLLLLLENLNREKFKPFLICPDYGNLVEIAKSMNIETEILNMPHFKNLNFINMFKTVCKLKKNIEEKNIDLIHTDSPRGTFYLGKAAKKLKIPLIWHARVSNSEPFFYEQLLYNLSTKIVAVSKAVKRRFENFPKANEKVIVIYNAVDLKEFDKTFDTTKTRKELGVKETDILIGSASQLIPEKGLGDLLVSIKYILGKFPEIKLLIAGNSNKDYRKFLENKVLQLGFNDRVIFTGFRGDIPEIMAALDIFVSPTLYEEGLSRSILEAMASSKPVITTPLGGNPEVVVDGVTGLFTPPKNPLRLAEAISELIKDGNKRKAMGKAGRRRIEQLFTIEEANRKIEEIYEKLLCQDM